MCSPSCLDFVQRSLTPSRIRGQHVLEVGSRNVNGSPRDRVLALQPASYLGVDQVEGPGVDQITRAEHLIGRFGREAFDVVITTEMLEHVEDWRTVLHNLKGVLRPGGLLLITTRSPGFPRHDFPADYWRFTLDDLRLLLSDLHLKALESDPAEPGVFGLARKPVEFHEADLSAYQVEGVPHG